MNIYAQFQIFQLEMCKILSLNNQILFSFSFKQLFLLIYNVKCKIEQKTK